MNVFRFVLNRSSLGALCGVALLASHAYAQPASLQTTKPIYPWRTEAQNKADGSGFSHCQVKNMYDNGILLMIAENIDHQRRLVLDFPQDKLITRQDYALQWQVDRQPGSPVTAIAVGARTLAIALDDTLTRQIARGNLLFLRGPNDTLGFDMMGMQDAVRSLQDCLVSNNVKPAVITFSKQQPNSSSAAASVESEPVARVASPAAVKVATKKPMPAPVQAAPQPIAPKPIIATPAKPTVQPAAGLIPDTLVAKLKQAGINPQNVMRVPEANKNEQPFDVVWNQGTMLVGLKSELPLPHQVMAQEAGRFSNQLQKICNGEFLAEGGEVEKRGDVYVMPAEVACSPHNTNGEQQPNTVAAMLLVMDTRALNVIFIEAPDTLGSQAVNLRDKLMAQY